MFVKGKNIVTDVLGYVELDMNTGEAYTNTWVVARKVNNLKGFIGDDEYELSDYEFHDLVKKIVRHNISNVTLYDIGDYISDTYEKVIKDIGDVYKLTEFELNRYVLRDCPIKNEFADAFREVYKRAGRL